MRRIVLAFACFFSFLFRRRLPRAALLEAGVSEAALPGGSPSALPPGSVGAGSAEATPARVASPGPSGTPPAGAEETAADFRTAPRPAAPPPVPGLSPEEAARAGAVMLLGILQREGRLVDFLMEPIDDYGDAQVGAAVRTIHRGCRKALEAAVKLEAALDGEEESRVTVAPGFDPARVRVLGRVAGDPPFEGTLKHHGWVAREVILPAPPSRFAEALVVAPAEVEVA